VRNGPAVLLNKIVPSFLDTPLYLFPPHIRELFSLPKGSVVTFGKMGETPFFFFFLFSLSASTPSPLSMDPLDSVFIRFGTRSCPPLFPQLPFCRQPRIYHVPSPKKRSSLSFPLLLLGFLSSLALLPQGSPYCLLIGVPPIQDSSTCMLFFFP